MTLRIGCLSTVIEHMINIKSRLSVLRSYLTTTLDGDQVFFQWKIP